MICISVELLTNRYHATPWGRAANEGDVEWPPSPLRLARALVDAWYRTPSDQRPAEEDVDRLLAALAEPPRILLPAATVGQSRHYMPLAGHGPKEETRLVLDAFVRIAEGEPIVFVWDELDLPGVLHKTLEVLAARVGYLGRAEAPAVLTVCSRPPMSAHQSRPLGEDAEVPDEWEPIRTLVLAEDATVQALSTSTAEMRKRRVASTPGGRFTTYLRREDALEPRRPAPPARRERRIEVLRFALDAPALPPITQALPIAELVRRSALSRVDDAELEAVAVLRGRATGTGRASEGHSHCHYLVTDEDGDGRIDHVTVWCPAGLDRAALGALDLRRLTSWRLDTPIHLVPLEALQTAAEPDRRTSAPRGPLAASARWETHTPFLPPRHPKRRGGRIVDDHESQVRLELRRRGLPEPVSVELLRSGRRHWGSFRRERDGAEPSVASLAIGVRLSFEEPVGGPIALGRNSHFGMGLFLPARR